MKLHMAKDGDSIESLSEKYGVPAERIRAANPHLETRAPLIRGIKVKIPVGPVKPATEAVSEAKPIEAAEAKPKADAEAETNANAAAEAVSEAKAEENENAMPEAKAEENDNAMPEAKAEENENAMPEANDNAAAAANENEAAAANDAEAKTVPPKWFWQREESAPQTSGLPNWTYPFQAPSPAEANAGVPAETQQAAGASLPSYYKTELPASNHSPLHVKWSGMNDGAAVHPYVTLPTPAVPAGATLPAQEQGYYPEAYGYGAAPFGSLQMPEPLPSPYPVAYGPGPMPMPAPTAYAPYGPGPEAYVQPFGMPAAYSPAASAKRSGCGCGGSSVSRLPYAMPLRSSALPDARAFTSGSEPPAGDASSETAVPAAAPAAAAKPAPQPAKKKPRIAKKKARVSSANARLRSLLRRSAASQGTARRKSRPWVND